MAPRKFTATIDGEQFTRSSESHVYAYVVVVRKAAFNSAGGWSAWGWRRDLAGADAYRRQIVARHNRYAEGIRAGKIQNYAADSLDPIEVRIVPVDQA